MTELTVTEKFHSVGQGLFYSVSIEHESSERPFLIVFDCGTKSTRSFAQHEIESVRNAFSTIDLLLISHLDSDHVNMLKDLVASPTKVKRAIVPYLRLDERAMAFARSDTPFDVTYADFIKDPAAFLVEHGVEDVMFIVSGRGDSDRLPEELEDEDRHTSEKSSGLPWKKIGTRLSSPPDSTGLSAGGISYWLDDLTFVVGDLWRFSIFESEADESSISKFNDEIRTKGILPLEKANWDEVFQTDLQNIYGALFEEDLNLTSLMCIHGPQFDYWGCSRCWACLGAPGRAPVCHIRRLEEVPEHFSAKVTAIKFIGESKPFWGYTLLAGDICLSKYWAKFKRRFASEVPLIKVFQVPHHGSKNGRNKYWHSDFLRDCLYANWVISSGYGNTYGHPSEQVVSEIREALGIEQPIFVNQTQGWCLKRIFLLDDKRMVVCPIGYGYIYLNPP